MFKLCVHKEMWLVYRSEISDLAVRKLMWAVNRFDVHGMEIFNNRPEVCTTYVQHIQFLNQSEFADPLDLT